MSLKSLSNEQLTASLKSLKKREDAVLVEILEHIQEVERRQLHLQLGFTSLYDYLMLELGYSENEAYRRIESARFLKSIPELKPLVESGSLTLTSISEVRCAVRAQEKSENRKVGREEQIALARAVENCSRKETQKILASKLPDYKPVQFERKQELAGGGIQITMRLSQPQRRKSERTKDIMARSGPVTNTANLFERLCDFFLRKKDLTAPSTRHSLSRQETPQKNPPIPKRLAIPMHIRRAVFRRDEGRCQFKRANGAICGTTHDIAIDHVIPVSAGGTNDLANLRCLCRAHNHWKADKMPAKPE